MCNNAPQEGMAAPSSVEAASNPQSLAKGVGLKPAMFRLADLQLITEPVIVCNLNNKLKAASLKRVTSIAEAVYTLDSCYISMHKWDCIHNVLLDFFEEPAGSREAAQAAIEQWPEVQKWCRRRLACPQLSGLHSIDEAELDGLAEQVAMADVYAPVRSAAQVLVAAGRQVLANGGVRR